jgi:hypothetical protein
MLFDISPFRTPLPDGVQVFASGANQLAEINGFSQLGGQRFIAMTGAKFLLAPESALSFHLPSNLATNGINRVRIDLTAADLYDMTFIRARGLKVFYETKIEEVHCDQLRSIFTEATGFEVSLGSLREDHTHSAQ